MPHRDKAPLGSPTWADLWTSDVEGSRKFYGELFGWESDEPDPQFGGYFLFNLKGVPVAGAMGDMGDMKASNTWKIFLDTTDIAKTIQAAEANGAKIIAPPDAVADLGKQAVLIDPTGADLGAWQAGTFPGFTVLNEHGAPSWFELHTRDYAAAGDFYRSVFHWETSVISETDEFRYTVMRDPTGEGELAGIMDASGFLPEGAPSQWSVYWEVDDADETVAKVKALGGSLVMGPEDTPYGRLAAVTDPTGAAFKLRTPPGS
jgi:predicted enzyme related to lactoylglutathione lyase